MLREIASIFQGAQWRWEDMCGPKGLHPWNPQTHDLGYCFQRLFLLIPSLFLLSAVSAYYVGSHVNWVVRGKLQDVAITFRSLVTLGLTIIPFIKIYYLLVSDVKHVMAIDYFTAGTECVAWLIHFGYILALKHRLGISPRGPILVLVLWSLSAVLSVISLRSVVLLSQSYAMELSVLILQVIYSLTLLPSEGVTSATYYSPCLVGSQYSQLGEHQPLLQAYMENESALGVAMSGVTLASKLLFHWVEPLFSSGLERKLNSPDDLFDLPVELSCNSISTKIEKALIGNADKYRTPVAADQPTPSAQYGSMLQGGDESQLLPRVEVVAPRNKYNVPLLRALHKCFAFEFYSIGFLKLISDVCGFAGPLLLNKMVTYVEDNTIDVEMGYLYAGGLLLSSLIGAFCESHFNMLMSVVSIKLRTSIVTTIFKKSLSVTKTEMNKNFSVGEVTNFMSTDTDRIVNSCPSFHAVWSIPLQLGVTLFLLHTQVGIAFLAGVVFSILLIPVNKYVANKIGLLSTKLMLHKDNRVNAMTEVIKGIKAIKFYVWEDYFTDKVTGIRTNEMKYLKGRKYLDAICVFLWATTPVIVTALTLSTYALLGNKLTAATVFTTIALLNMLIAPLNAFPWVLNGLTEAWVSIKRIQRLIDLHDMNENNYYNLLTDAEIDNNVVLSLNNATFTYATAMKIPSHGKKQSLKKKGKGKSSTSTEYKNIQRRDSSVESSLVDDNQLNLDAPFTLSTITMTVKQGDFVCIVGKVGSGKSSMINAILAEMIKLDGEICISEIATGFGYVSQKPWLQRGTIMENILFGKAFDETKYRNVLSVCGLTDDVALLGNNANVGEGGGSLSGGQVTRIALARACYQEMQVYLLDDVLSAVDAKVGAHIYQKCIMGLLKEKTRIFVTHSLQYAAHANHVIVMDGGTIIKQGPPKVILKELDEFFATSDYELSDNETPGTSYGSPVVHPSMDNVSLNNDNLSRNTMMEEERQAVGSLDSWVLGMYWKSVGHWLALTTLLSLVLMQVSRNSTDLWLSFWVSAMSPHNATNYTTPDAFIHDDNTLHINVNNTNFKTTTEHALAIGTLIKNITGNVIKQLFDKATNEIESFETSRHLQNAVEPNSDDTNVVSYYLSFYAGFAVLNSIFTLLRAFLFAYGGIHAATVIHEKLLSTIIKGKMKFFDITPAGRLLNRFSSDTYTVDDSLPFILNILLAQVFGVIGCIVVTAYGLPWVCLVIVPLIPVYHWLQHRYRLTSRELKRISSVTLSPIYTYFNDTLEGTTTIRALTKTDRWSYGGEYLVERSQQSVLCSAATSQWLGLRLRLMGAALLGGASVVAVAQRNLDFVDAGLVGLAISYALTVTSLLGGVINAFTETEREMIAVERVGEYIRQIEPEGMDRMNMGLSYLSPPYGWPSMGIVSFKDVVLKYRHHLSPSLKGVSFDTLPGEKIGVVGRTGAGKSSLFSALFRLCELYGGAITIDSVDISELSLDTLRSRIAIIPQEPFVFSGSIRSNLDPLNQYIDTEVWSAIEKCGAKQIIKRRGGLSASASDLSRGHMQLLCLARAILQSAKIVCIDEATANVDHETDKIIQSTIKCSFRKSTVLTIAHRITTILSSDRVLVMGDGQVVEFDSPKVLMNDPNSQFYQLLNQSVLS